MVARNDIIWADLGQPAGRRPVCVLTRDAAIFEVLTVVDVRAGHPDHQGNPLGGRGRSRNEGLPERSVISCDNVITVPVADLDADPVGHLDENRRAELDRALRYALDIVY